MIERADYGFDKTKRLLSPQEFRRVYKHGRRHRKGQFIVVSCPSRLGYSRLGVVVSKKVSKKAVQRNRIKRLIRETYRLCHDQRRSSDYIVIALSGSATLNNATLFFSLNQLWKKT